MPSFEGTSPSHSESEATSISCGSARGIERHCVQSAGLLNELRVLIAAPSGCGKTELARQLSARHRCSLWIDARAPRPDDITLPALVACGAVGPDILVIDALELVAPDAPDVLLVQHVMADERLRQSHVVLVTRGVHESAVAMLRGFRFVGKSHLALTTEEALELAAVASVDAERAEVLNRRCHGHIAVFSALLDQVNVGSLSETEPARIDAWLSHLVALMDSRARSLLLAAAVLGEARLSQLSLLGVPVDRELVRGVVEEFPLATLKTCGVGQLLTVDDMVFEHGLPPDAPELLPPLESVVSTLMESGKSARAADVILRWGSPESALRFVRQFGARMIAGGHEDRLELLLAQAPLRDVMADSGVLLTWAAVELEHCRDDEALARARAASVVAQHQSNRIDQLKARLIIIDCLRNMGRWDEASRMAACMEPRAQSDDEAGIVAQISLSSASLCLVVGQIAVARTHLERARTQLANLPSDGESDHWDKCRELEGVLMVLELGDSFEATRHWSPILNRRGCRRSRRLQAMLNMGVCLVEVGRIERAQSLLRCVLGAGDDWFAAHALPPMACARLSREEAPENLCLFDEAIRAALSSDKASAAQVRVYQSAALRALGHADEALEAAERAFEMLAVVDVMEFRRLAALEVAASLLALGDSAAARNWAEPVVSAGFGQNQHHALRAAMILAMCDLRDGDPARGIDRLKPFGSHVRSENSNWQAAMYMRAFPELLGMFAEAFGVKAIPTHLLRMVLPQHAERSLRRSKEFMQPEVWRQLGLRALGKTQFAQLVERNGQPICHVRLFGGLEVSVDGRVVQERDWRKRKARLLFAMLAVRRGAEIPRDELLDHLWPDLDDERAKNNFYVAWSAMKAALMGCSDRSAASPYIQSTRGRCRVVREAVRLDLDEFDEALTAAREGEASGDIKAAVSAYERVSATYRGDLLSGDVYDDWFAPIRDGYRMQFIDAMAKATELLLSEDDPCEALLYVRRGLGVDPLREDLYQLALRCHILAGQRSAAIDTFLQCRSNLGEELGLDPSGDTMKLYQQVLAMEECPRTDSYGLS